MGAHPGGLFARDSPVDPYGEDLEFWAEARTASHGDDFDAWIEQWVLGPADQEDVPGPAGRRPDRPAAPAGRARLVARRRGRPPARPRRAGGGLGAAAVHGARYLAGRVDDARGRRRAGRGRGGQPGRLAGRRPGPGRRAPRWSSPPSSGCGATSRRRPTRSSSTTGASPPPPCWATPTRCWATLVSGPGTTLLGCLGAAQIDRSRQHQLHGHPRQGLPGRLGRGQRRGLERPTRSW